MSIPKTSRLCNTNPVSRDDANATVRDLNARIDSVYTQEAALIATNTADIATNTAAIATNTADIATNTAAITANALLAFGKTFSGPSTALALAHGVPTLIPNPLGTGLSGVVPLNCDTQSMPALTVTTAGAPAGQAYLTALYPLAEQFVQLTNTTSTQSIANNTATALTFPASPTINNGSNISYDGSSILTFNKTGRYLLNGSAVIAFNATGARWAAFQYNGTSQRIALGFVPVGDATNASTYANITAAVNLTAGSKLQFVFYQDSGGGLVMVASTNNPLIWTATQLSNDSSLTANVTYALLAS